MGHPVAIVDLESTPESDHETDHWGLPECVDHLVPWSCLPNMELLLEKVDVTKLTDEKIKELSRYGDHKFPEISPMLSITFLHGRSAVRIIEGIRHGDWTLNQVQDELKQYRALRKEASRC